MLESMAAPQARGKKSNDVIFGASAAAKADIAKNGADAVTDATIGAILDEEGRLVCLSVVEETYREIPMTDLIAYAPVAGLPAYLKDVEECCFEEWRPKGFTSAVSTAGGTGALHHVIHNYSEPGDEILTADWYWSAYKTLCEDNGRHLRTFRMLDDAGHFDAADFTRQLSAMAERQAQVVAVINTPAHNPTGYSLTDGDWDTVLGFLKHLAEKGKRIVLLIDVSYIDYAGPGAKEFFRKLEGLPEEILVVIAFSLSKSFTLYGQRIGAMIALSANARIAEEFAEINTYTNRATWSNNCRGAMECLIRIWEDPAKRAAWKSEQQAYYRLIQERADIFMKEAKEIHLPVLPYQAGYFISVPLKDSKKVCETLHRDHIYLVPLAAGARLAVCAVPKRKMHGIAAKLKAAMEVCGEM